MKCKPLSLYKNDLLRAISEVADNLALLSVTNALNCWLRSMTRNIIVELVLAMQLVVVQAAPPTNRVTLHVHTGFGWKTKVHIASKHFTRTHWVWLKWQRTKFYIINTSFFKLHAYYRNSGNFLS